MKISLLECGFINSYVTFMRSLFVPHLSVFWYLRRDVGRDYGISCVSSLISVWAHLSKGTFSRIEANIIATLSWSNALYRVSLMFEYLWITLDASFLYDPVIWKSIRRLVSLITLPSCIHRKEGNYKVSIQLPYNFSPRQQRKKRTHLK